MRRTGWLVLIFGTGLVASNIIPPDERCVTAIYNAYDYISFAGSPPAGFWGTRCLNPLKVTSIYASTEVHCSSSAQAAGLSQLATLCRQVAHLELIPRDKLATNLTSDQIQRMRVVDYEEISRHQRIDAPVILSSAYYSRTFQTIDAWQFETWTHYAYGLAGYGFWAGVLAVGIVRRCVQQFLLSRRASTGHQRHPLVRSIGYPFLEMYNWIDTHLVVASPLPSHGRHILWWTFPTRIEALVTFAFWFISTVLCLVGYRTFLGNIYWPDVSAQLLRYAADRTGILSFANLPLLWIFAGRNNIFLWATGWSFATFNIYHRHVAWIATIQAFIHTVLYFILFIQNGNAWKKMQKPYLFWGTMAMAAMILVLPSAVDWFRRRNYETFLLLHIAFSVATVIGCFYHTVIFEGHEYWLYLWPVVGIWALDRSLRLIRLAYCNIYVRAHAGKGLQYTRSLATYDENSDVIRLEVMLGSWLLRPTAGQYYYLYQPFRLTGWESHPFTLGSWSFDTGPLTPSLLPSEAAKHDQTVDISQIPLLADSSGTGYSCSGEDSQDSNQLKLVFWIRPFDGWTRSLRQQCKGCSDRSLNTTILMEGPYGEEFPAWNYESILFVAGGTGIAAIVPYIQDHLARSATADGSATRIQDMHLVWTTRQAAFVRQLAIGELSPALARSDFDAAFYVTSPGEGYNDEDLRSSVHDEVLDKDLEINMGRPDLQSRILSHAHDAQLRGCSALVLVCGPSAMADQARDAVYRAMRQGYQGIRYVEESFTW